MEDQVPFSKPVEDSVPKVDDTVAVGENLEFQRRWWRFERIIWCVFGAIILADTLGVFGRGWFAHAERTAADGSLHLKYERVERTMTPSMMVFRFGPQAVHDGRIQLYVSESVVKELGAQRISPQPAESVLGNKGLTYTFPVTDSSGTVQIALEPSFPGAYRIVVGVAGQQPVSARVVVMP